MDEPTTQLVASTFVDQYYTILCYSPEHFKRFYDSDVGGTTLSGDHLLLSRRWQHYHLLSVDAQVSAGNGVFVVVIGVLTCCDEEEGVGESKKFSQSFFLASFKGTNSSKGFFVSSDVFRFLDDQKPEITSFGSFLASKQDRGVDPTPNPSTESFLESTQDKAGDPTPNPSTKTFLENTATPFLEFSLKKTFLSVLQSNNVPLATHARPKTPPPPRPAARNGARKEETSLDRKISMLNKEELRKKQRIPVASPARNNGKASYSIFVGSLSLNVTAEELHQELSKFGKIVVGDRGIRLKPDSWRRNCYAFVEYEDEVSKQRALQASSVTIGGRKVIINETKDRKDSDDHTKC